MNNRSPAMAFVCPLCGNADGTLERTVSAREAALQYANERFAPARYRALVERIDSLWDGEPCSLVRCARCDAVTAMPFVGGDEAFYELAYGHTDWYPANKWEFVVAADLLLGSDRHPKPRRILEIGAGSGAFIRKLIARGLDPRDLAAVEFSDKGRSRLRSLGIGFVTETLDRVATAGEPFDAVVLFQVLEHLDSLDHRLKLIRDVLVADGRVVIAVPNPLWIEHNERSGALFDQPPTHITRFSDQGMHRLAERTGFVVETAMVQPIQRTTTYALLEASRFACDAQRNETVAARIRAVQSQTVRRALTFAALAGRSLLHVRDARGISAGVASLYILRRDDRGSTGPTPADTADRYEDHGGPR